MGPGRGREAITRGDRGLNYMGLKGQGDKGRDDSHQRHWVQRGREVLEGPVVPGWVGYEHIRMGKEGREGSLWLSRTVGLCEQRSRQRADGEATCKP